MIDNVIAITGGRVEEDHRRQALEDLLDALWTINDEYEALRSQNDLMRQLLQCAAVYLSGDVAADAVSVARLLKRIGELGGSR